MTWTFKHKRSDRPMVAEYLCPVHGRFELTVDRDAKGNPPDEQPCPSDEREFMPTDAGVYRANLCGLTSPFAISKPGYSKVKNVEAARGGYEKPARETYTDTTNLGEGQSLEDWQDDREKVWERHRENEVHQMAKEI